MMTINKKTHKCLSELKRYNFDTRYVANNKGIVYLIKDEKEKSYEAEEMKPFTTKDGYLEYVLTDKTGKKKHIQAQRVTAGLYLDDVKGKEFVNHKYGVKTNNYYKDLEYTTHQENIQHSFDVLGKKVWNAK